MNAAVFTSARPAAKLSRAEPAAGICRPSGCGCGVAPPGPAAPVMLSKPVCACVCVCEREISGMLREHCWVLVGPPLQGCTGSGHAPLVCCPHIWPALRARCSRHAAATAACSRPSALSIDSHDMGQFFDTGHFLNSTPACAVINAVNRAPPPEGSLPAGRAAQWQLGRTVDITWRCSDVTVAAPHRALPVIL